MISERMIKNVTRLASGAAAAAVALLAVSDAQAAGFALNEITAREQGMVSAVVGLADRPSAVYFNPAGLANQQGLAMDVSLSIVAPQFGYDTNVPATGEPIRVDAQNDVHFVPTVFANYRVHDRVAVGLGVYSPYGLGVRWKDFAADDVSWWGRSAVQEVSITAMYFNPSVAVKLHDMVYLGAGFVVVQAAATLQRALTSSSDPADDVNMRLSGDDLGFGGNAGLLVKAVPERIHVGIAYRSGVGLGLEGDAAFTNGGSADNIPSSIRPSLLDGKVRVDLALPHTFSFGVATFPLEGLFVGIALDFVTWSIYDTLAVEFPDNPSQSTTQRKDWHNTFTVRLGAEYEILEKNLPVRLGLIYDESPVPDDTVGPDLPDADRYGIAFGVGYTWRGLRADVGYEFLLFPTADTQDNVAVVGSRDGLAHIFGFSLGYQMDI